MLNSAVNAITPGSLDSDLT